MITYSIQSHKTYRTELTFKTIKDAYYFSLKKLKPLGLSNFVITEHNLIEDDYISMNLSDFVFDVENNNIQTIGVYMPY